MGKTTKLEKTEISFQASFAPINSAILLLPHPRLTIEVPQSELGRAARLALWLKSSLQVMLEMDGFEAVCFEARVPEIAAGYQCSAGDGIRFKLDLSSEFLAEAVELQAWGRGAFDVTILPIIENNGDKKNGHSESASAQENSGDKSNSGEAFHSAPRRRSAKQRI